MNNIDVQIFSYINNLPHNFVADFIFLLVHNLTRQGLVYFVLAIWLLLMKRQVLMNLVTLGTLAGFATYVLNDWILKNLFQRLRPHEVLSDIQYIAPAPDSFSMPSGQAAVAFALLTMVVLVVPNKMAHYIFGIFALLVAFDRIYLGHHYPSDVLVGGVVGVIVSILIFNAQKQIFRFGKSLRFNK